MADKKRKPRTDGRTVPAWGDGADAGSYDHSRNAEFQAWFTIWAKEVLRIARPGAMMLVFGGTRTVHRLTCAIEDAGWQIRDCCMFLYGSGFPKSHNIAKAINKKAEDVFDKARVAAPAQLWDGWGTALKPAWEPIVIAMKPLDGTFAQNAEKWGVAGLNIDGARIDYQSEYDKSQATPQGKCTSKEMAAIGAEPDAGRELERIGFERPKQKGRWPANLILDEEAAALVDQQSGGASRFFYCAKASRAERNAGLKGMAEKRPDTRTDTGKGIWVEKGTAKQSNHHPTVKPLALMEYLCRLTMTPMGGIVLDPFAGSGSTCIACIRTGREFIGIEKDESYCEIARKRIAAEQKAGQGRLF